MLYIKTKGKYINGIENELEIIQMNADNIIEDIENNLLEIVDNNLSNSEDTSFALPIIMVDAFMRCKILEMKSIDC